jgi:hypothetical protein
MSSPLRFGFGFDVRNPTDWHKPFPDLYAETLEFIAWTESLGFGNCWFAEHHGIDDGYLPSPLMMGAAVAAKTGNMRIGTGVGLLPHYHPVRFAEDTAVLDNISNGRLELCMGIGYLKFECEAYGIESKTRGKRSDEVLEIVRRLWEGETVTYKGEFYDIRKARIFPLPVQRPGIPMFIGAVAPPGLKRAARLGDGYAGPLANWPAYVEAVKACGKPESMARILSFDAADMWSVVSDDPEAALNEIAPHCYYQMNTYAEWQKDTDWGKNYINRMDFETFKKSGAIKAMTPEDAIDYIRSRQALAPIEAFCMQVPSGMPLKTYAKFAETFAKKVLPAFRCSI